jgi:glutathione S-transferase
MAPQDDFLVCELTYGNAPGRMGRILRGKVPNRISLIERLQRENSQLKDAYDIKLVDTQNWIRDQAYAKTISDINARFEDVLEALEKRLHLNQWIAGDQYSIVDIAWSVMLARAGLRLSTKELRAGAGDPG